MTSQTSRLLHGANLDRQLLLGHILLPTVQSELAVCTNRSWLHVEKRWSPCVYVSWHPLCSLFCLAIWISGEPNHTVVFQVEKTKRQEDTPVSCLAIRPWPWLWETFTFFFKFSSLLVKELAWHPRGLSAHSKSLQHHAFYCTCPGQICILTQIIF